MSNFSFCSISSEQIDRISQKNLLLLMLTRSMLGVLSIIFGTFVTELWPLINAKICFLSIS